MSLRVIRRVEIRSADIADRWRAQYFNNGQWMDDEKKAIWIRLNDSLISADQIDAVIRNNTWTHHYCSGCGHSKPDLVKFTPQDDDYDSIHICRDCIGDALKALF